MIAICHQLQNDTIQALFQDCTLLTCQILQEICAAAIHTGRSAIAWHWLRRHLAQSLWSSGLSSCQTAEQSIWPETTMVSLYARHSPTVIQCNVRAADSQILWTDLHVWSTCPLNQSWSWLYCCSWKIEVTSCFLLLLYRGHCPSLYCTESWHVRRSLLLFCHLSWFLVDE